MAVNRREKDSMLPTKKPSSISIVENTTKKFYDGFKKEHGEFLLSIEGITNQNEREWYTLLMLNRFMFLFFIQHKGFLAGDKNYLQNSLKKVQELYGKEACSTPSHTFYRYFLLKLFHEGLNKREYARETEQLLGNVPYLGCDLFDRHILERHNSNIQIPNRAFARLFNFFQKYDWCLSDTTSNPSNDCAGEEKYNKINPDILGSIFEQFINQQERGAYYTKKDITNYISKNTIIPFIFESAERRCPDAFSSTGPIWPLARHHYNNYIYTTIRKENDLCPLAESTDEANETEVKDITCIQDLITYNLDIEKFAWDAIASCEKPDQLLAFYESIASITILDPTCGSGAFLLAALHILRPLYEICLRRMNEIVHVYDQQEQDNTKMHMERCRDILRHAGKEVTHHLEYFILKSIITKNLYGVDLMEEAIEICKLGLFLQLIALVDAPADIEPLRNLDYHVLVGNTLVGLTNLDEIYSMPNQEQTPTNTLPRPFHWCVEFYSIMKNGGFDVIVGNPPYVEYKASTFPYMLHHFKTLACANLYPCVVERSYQLLSPQGYQGMILPLAAFATKNMTPFIDGFYRWFPRSWLSFYHFRPSMLFSGGKVANIPTTIFIAKAAGSEQRFSTKLIKWPTEKRDQLFSQLTYCQVTVPRDSRNKHYYPKLGLPIENTIMEKIRCHQPIETYLEKTPNHNRMWYRSAGGLYWKVFVNFSWPYKTTSNKQCSFQQNYDRDIFVALFNSSTFWWYYTVTFDTFNLKDYMLFGFRFTYPQDTTIIQDLCKCCQELMDDFRANAQHLKRGSTGSYTVYARQSKHIIDKIDQILAHHYGFTEEERDFIVNYDLKYRMGSERES